MFEINGHKGLCIDTTHGTNAFWFLLITFIVPDEYRRGMKWYYMLNFNALTYNTHVTGQPIGWCISDNTSGQVVSAFLKSIHKCSPRTHVNVLMTDDGKFVYWDSLTSQILNV